MNFPRDPHLLRYGVGRGVSYRLIMSIKGEHMENDTEKNILAFLLFSFILEAVSYIFMNM